MSAPTAAFLVSLKEAADSAAVAEKAFRREAAERIKALEQERAFAFRRLNVMRLVIEAVTGAESEEIGVAAALAVLRSRLGWSSDSESRSAVLSRFALVAQTAFANLRDSAEDPVANIGGALAEFEVWYSATYAISFWSLFEHQMAETPVVDF
jgi:hypothetical protein